MYQNLPTQINPRMPRRLPHSLGFARYALSFDDVDDYVEVPSLTWTPTAFSVEWRMKATTFGNSLHEIGGTGAWDRFWFHTAHGNGSVYVGTDLVTRFSLPAGTVELNAWSRFVYTYDGANGRFYKNETLLAGPKAQNPSLAWLGFQVGSSLHGFGSIVDNIRIYNWALSPKEIKWNTLNYHNPIRSGLVLWLPMEEGAGEIVYDKSGHGNHGTLLPAGAGPTWQRLRQWELRSTIE